MKLYEAAIKSCLFRSFFLFQKWFRTEFLIFFSSKNDSDWNSEDFSLPKMVQNGILRFFSSKKGLERNSMGFFREMVRNGIPRVFLFREMVWKKIPRVFSSEKWFGTEFWGFFSSEKWFGTEFLRCFSSAKQAEFRRNRCLFHLVLHSAEKFVVRKWQP